MSEMLPLQSAQTPEAILEARYDQLHPAVREYAQHLREQIGSLFQEYGLRDYGSFREQAMGEPGRIPKEIVEHLQLLLHHLQEAVQKDRLPAEEYTITVEDAVNPYYWVYQLNSCAGKGTEKEITRTVDLAKILEEDRQRYRSVGLLAWADNLPRSVFEIPMTTKQIRILRKNIQEGAVPVFLPPLAVQLETLEQALGLLKPRYIVHGGVIESASVPDPLIAWDVLRDIIRYKDESLVASSQKRSPYLMLARPLGIPDSIGLTVAQQQKRLKIFRRNNRYLETMHIPEYLALQYVFSQRMSEDADRNGYQLQELPPLDMIPGATWFTTTVIHDLEEGDRVPSVSTNPPLMAFQSVAMKEPSAADRGMRVCTRFSAKTHSV